MILKKAAIFILLLSLIMPMYTSIAQEELQPILAEVVPYHLNVRAEPSTDAAILGQLTIGTIVMLLGTEDIFPNDEVWFFVDQVDGDLVGWVHADYLQLPTGIHGTDFEAVTFVPVLLRDGRTPAQPVQTEGIVVAHSACVGSRSYNDVNVREQPHYNAAKLGVLPCHTLVGVYGHYEDWLYIKQIGGEITGWVWRPRLTLPFDFNYFTLPELAPVSNPPLTGLTLAPINTLPAITHQAASMRLEPSRHYPIVYTVPANTALTLLGRNANSRYFKVTVDGLEGWIYWADVEITGDPNRLPILSTKGSRTDQYD